MNEINTKDYVKYSAIFQPLVDKFKQISNRVRTAAFNAFNSIKTAIQSKFVGGKAEDYQITVDGPGEGDTLERASNVFAKAHAEAAARTEKLNSLYELLSNLQANSGNVPSSSAQGEQQSIATVRAEIKKLNKQIEESSKK